MKLATSADGVRLIQSFEGFSAKLYNDQADHCTIGYGHKVHDGPINGGEDEEPFKRGLTQEQATELLHCDLVRFELAINQLVKVPLAQAEFDALASFTYNLGEGALEHSTLLRKLNEGDRAGAMAEFARWIHVGGKESAGLRHRREQEAQLFGTPLITDQDITA